MKRETGEKSCPKCRLINPPEAERCDCGWDFITGSQEQSYLPKKALPATAGIGAGLIVAYILMRVVVAVIHSATP